MTLVIDRQPQKNSLFKERTEQIHQDFPRIGISRCLLGDAVRYDGGHKRDALVTEVLTPFVEWVPVCPEVEAGLGTPREPMRLIEEKASLHLVTIRTGIDHTRLLQQYSRTRVQELNVSDLDGFIFKKNSPSCGMHRVKIYPRKGSPTHQGRGLFSHHVQQAFPLLPVEEEGRLNDPSIRENFIERIFGYQRWKMLHRQSRLTRGMIVQFHAHHKYLLLTHSRAHYQRLGQLVATAGHDTARDLAARYGLHFMEALKVKATVNKHVNVLQHLAGHLKTHLQQTERVELQEYIHDYHRRLIPLTVPLTLIKHYVGIWDISYLLDQAYLNPHPKELMLRNHV